MSTSQQQHGMDGEEPAITMRNRCRYCNQLEQEAIQARGWARIASAPDGEPNVRESDLPCQRCYDNDVQSAIESTPLTPAEKRAKKVKRTAMDLTILSVYDGIHGTEWSQVIDDVADFLWVLADKMEATR